VFEMKSGYPGLNTDAVAVAVAGQSSWTPVLVTTPRSRASSEKHQGTGYMLYRTWAQASVVKMGAAKAAVDSVNATDTADGSGASRRLRFWSPLCVLGDMWTVSCRTQEYSSLSTLDLFSSNYVDK